MFLLSCVYPTLLRLHVWDFTGYVIVVSWNLLIVHVSRAGSVHNYIHGGHLVEVQLTQRRTTVPCLKWAKMPHKFVNFVLVI